jgi:hypothetical protein
MALYGVALCTISASDLIAGSRTEKIAAFSLLMDAVAYFDTSKQDNPQKSPSNSNRSCSELRWQELVTADSLQ